MANVTYRDVENTIRDIERNMAVVGALLKRKNYAPEELRRINQAMGGAATLVNKAVSFGRKMGESTSENLLDRIDNRIDELEDLEEVTKAAPEEEKYLTKAERMKHPYALKVTMIKMRKEKEQKK